MALIIINKTVPKYWTGQHMACNPFSQIKECHVQQFPWFCPCSAKSNLWSQMRKLRQNSHSTLWLNKSKKKLKREGALGHSSDHHQSCRTNKRLEENSSQRQQTKQQNPSETKEHRKNTGKQQEFHIRFPLLQHTSVSQFCLSLQIKFLQWLPHHFQHLHFQYWNSELMFF